MVLPPGNGCEVLPLKCYTILNFNSNLPPVRQRAKAVLWVFYNPPSTFSWAVLADKLTDTPTARGRLQ